MINNAICPRCGKSLGRFKKCKGCKRLYDKQHFVAHATVKIASVTERKRSLQGWYKELKHMRPCRRCGGVFPWVCMDFDHLPGFTKTMEVSKMVRLGYEKEKILVEISRTQLLCSNCHRLITHERLIGSKKKKEGDAIV